MSHSTASQSQANRVEAERRLELSRAPAGKRLAVARRSGSLGPARCASARSAHLRLEQQNRTESCLSACCLDTTMPSSAARLTTGNTRVSLHIFLVLAPTIR